MALTTRLARGSFPPRIRQPTVCFRSPPPQLIRRSRRRRLATLRESIVDGLQSTVGAEEVVTIDSSIKISEAVEIIEGPFRGLEVMVTCLLPAKERVRVLFEFLGRSVEMEISTAKVLAA